LDPKILKHREKNIKHLCFSKHVFSFLYMIFLNKKTRNNFQQLQAVNFSACTPPPGPGCGRAGLAPQQQARQRMKIVPRCTSEI
jgi:hypothetical protein